LFSDRRTGYPLRRPDSKAANISRAADWVWEFPWVREDCDQSPLAYGDSMKISNRRKNTPESKRCKRGENIAVDV